MLKKKRKTKKSTKAKPKAELSPDEKERQKRERQKEKLADQRRRGTKVDFTKSRINTKSMRDHVIRKCPRCNRNGEATEIGMSTVYLHRGFMKPGDVLRNYKHEEVPNIKMTDYCLV